ncbi:transcriptional regulator with XRE-family HTH domain [Paenibacillus castaneae]|uniref:helix-turn-helix domain-containing protein n=1 Tax=Paenibacillus castaneae TaxID=474957 RepID=UPI000C9ADA3E|nr:XRE family transcriptional regulator [Paenibacillus castaneae]NIK77601.1 transcriptional regulator with XRE-family HTH domain [Paenibacillus castaneae]
MNIGSTIRTIRKRKNITITQICEETGLSQGFMSQVENNKTSPSISTLESIANALKVPLAYLLLRQEERMNIVRKEERQITQNGIMNIKVEQLSSTKNVRMRLVEFPPGTSTGDVPHAHEGEEVHFVVKGRIYAEQGEDKDEFGEGDSYSWNACTPHLVRNIGEDIAIVLISIYNDSDQGKDFL